MEKAPTLNRKQTRTMIYSKPTKFRVIATENGNTKAYIHPTKGYRGNRKAITEFRVAMGYK